MAARDWLRYVYLIEARAAGLDGEEGRPMHKIGSSCDPVGRAAQLCRDLVLDGHLAHAFPSADAFGVEHALHRRLAAYRVEGGFGREWYRLEPQHVELIRGVEKADTIAGLPAELHPPVAEATCAMRLDPALVKMVREIAAARRTLPFQTFDDLVRGPIVAAYNATLPEGE